MNGVRSIAYFGVAAWAAYSLGIGAYVLGSYLIMHAHVEARPLRSWLREIVREGFYAFLTQPLLLVFYLAGRTMGGRRDGRPVLLVHGYMQNRACFIGLARALARHQLGPIYAFNYAWFAPLDSIVARLDRFIERVCAETGATDLDIVTHSFGGVVALEYLHTAERARVRRLVTIAGPHAGVAWRGPIVGASGTLLRAGSEFVRDRRGRAIAVPCLSIYSTHDNIVFPMTTSALGHRGARDVAASEAGHLAILFERPVANEIASFLSDAA